MSHDGAHYKTTKKQFNWTFKKGIWTWSCHGYENCLFTKSVLCFSSRSKAWLCPSKPDRQGGKNQLGVPDLSSDGQDPTEKLSLLICTDLEQMSIIVARKKAGSLHSEQPRGTDCFCSARWQRGRAWKGALFARGDAWMPWLGCRGWHVVFLETGWPCKLYFRLWFYFGPIFLTLTQSWKSGSNRVIQAQP